MPDKFYSIPDFVTDSQANEIVKLLPKVRKHGKARNQVIRYGSIKPYPSGFLKKEIPDVFKKLNIPFEYDSVTINEYMPGQMLDWHIDKPESGNRIIILSLLSDCDILFRNKKESLNILNFEMLKNTLSIFSDSLRWDYEHKVIANEYRVSIVFRNSKETIKR